jgi:hypothetical protein
MQPSPIDLPMPSAQGRAPIPIDRAGGRRLVLALQTGGGRAVAENLRRVAAEPRLLEQLRRIVVVDQVGEPVAAEAAAELGRSVAWLLRVVEQRDLGVAGGLARGLQEALSERGAQEVLLVGAGALIDAAALLGPLAVVRADPGFDVLSWRAMGDPAAGIAALLPLDAVRAVGLTHAGLGTGALADLVLRAHAAGFRARPADAGVEAAGAAVPTVRERLLLTMLHEPTAARGPALRAGLAAEVRALRALRSGEVAARHRDVAAVLVAPESEAATAVRAGAEASPSGRGAVRQGLLLHVDLWRDWAGLRRRVRAAAFELAAPEGWAARFAEPEQSTSTAESRSRATGAHGTARAQRSGASSAPRSA